jgi:hypothetical protein
MIDTSGIMLISAQASLCFNARGGDGVLPLVDIILSRRGFRRTSFKLQNLTSETPTIHKAVYFLLNTTINRGALLNI